MLREDSDLWWNAGISKEALSADALTDTHR
jgi:hypothetical protein